MAWVEFHGAKIKRLPKFKAFRRALQWSINEGLGFLGSFWSEVIELREDGDISDWSHEDIAEAGNTALDPERVWDALVNNRWVDAKDGKILVHDWLDAAGTFLRSKYGSGRRRNLDRLREIWSKHGKAYGKEDGQQDGTEDGQPPTPNQPNQTEEKAEDAGARVDGMTQAILDRAKRVWDLYPSRAEKDGRLIRKTHLDQDAIALKLKKFPAYPWEEHARLERLNRTPLNLSNWIVQMPDEMAITALRDAEKSAPHPAPTKKTHKVLHG